METHISNTAILTSLAGCRVALHNVVKPFYLYVYTVQLHPYCYYSTFGGTIGRFSNTANIGGM